jgi:CheY-like chemotaxis protein
MNCPGARFVIDLHQTPIYKDSLTNVSLGDDSSTPLTTEESFEGGASITPPNEKEAAITFDLPEELTVLFVDDDAVLRKLFSRSVARVKPKWHIDQASYGEEALELVGARAYDIIFIDQYMASDEKMLLGTETVVVLRNEKHVASLICGLSANDMKEQFIAAGANTFMTKPFPCEKNSLERELTRVWGASIMLK